MSKDIDDFTAFAHEVHGVNTDARFYEVTVISEHGTPRAKAYFRLRLGVPSAKYLAGARKGEINWGKRDKRLDRELIVPFSEFDAFVAKRKAAQVLP